VATNICNSQLNRKFTLRNKKGTAVAKTPVEIVQALLKVLKDREAVSALCSPDVTYVSLNYSNPDLQKSMPWCGTSYGPEAIVSTFVRVGEYWRVDDFSPQAIFGDDKHVAVFGSMTVTSAVLGKTVTSPFSIFCKVADEKVTYMQFMEDTFATSSTFRSSGVWTFRSNPAGGEVSA
jgi:ketosteroid isomerase-like protein